MGKLKLQKSGNFTVKCGKFFNFFVAKCSYFCGIWDFKWQFSKMPDLIKLISRLCIDCMYQKFNFLSLFNSDPFFLKLKDLLKSLTC